MISIDLRMLHASGVGTYLRNLVPLVISACPNAEFCLMGKLDEISSHHWAHSKNVLLVDCWAPSTRSPSNSSSSEKLPRVPSSSGRRTTTFRCCIVASCW